MEGEEAPPEVPSSESTTEPLPGSTVQADTIPAESEKTPPEAEKSPLDVHTTPLTAEQSPLEVLTAPPEVKNSPLEAAESLPEAEKTSPGAPSLPSSAPQISVQQPVVEKTAREKEHDKEIYPENLLKNAEGGYNNFLPAWAFPRVQIKAVVTVKDAGKEMMFGKDKKDETEQKVVLKDTIDAINKNMVKAVLGQFERLTISKIHHLARLGEFATILFREKKLVDVLIHVLDRTYYAHKHVLCCHSEFFNTLLVPHYKPPDVITDVTLSNVNPQYFQDFLHFCYYGEVELSQKTIAPLLNLCNKLNAQIMRSRIHMFIAAHGELHPSLVKQILTSKTKADRPLAILEAIEKFDELRDDVQFLGRLSFEDIMEILSSDELNVNSELHVFWNSETTSNS